MYIKPRVLLCFEYVFHNFDKSLFNKILLANTELTQILYLFFVVQWYLITKWWRDLKIVVKNCEILHNVPILWFIHLYFLI